MATAPVQTFQDWPADPAVQSIVSVASDPRAPGDTLADVIADSVRRNKLIDDNNLLKGIRMTAGGPQPSARELIVRPESLNAIVNNTAMIESTTVEAEFTETLMESNYNAVSVQVSAPYVTANASYSNESSYKNTETEKTVMTSSRYLFPQGRIDFSIPGSGFQDAVQLSPTFMDMMTAALGKSTRAEQREALYAVLEEFGHVFRVRLQIGGTLSAHTMETFSRTENETSVKEDIKAGLEVAVKDWGTSVTAGHGNTQSTVKTEQGRTLTVKYIVEGGDYTKIQNTSDWIASTNQSEYWRVIEVNQVVPVVDMLPDDMRATANMLMTPLLGQWVGVEQVPYTDAFPVTIYRPKAGTVPDGWYFLGHSADGSQALIVKPTLPPKSGRNVAATTGQPGSGFTNQPFPSLPQYEFLSTYFGGYTPGVAPDSALGALRPGLFLEGRWELVGDTIATAVYITHLNTAQDPVDECFDLKSVVQVRVPGSDNPPHPRWVLRKNVVLFDSGEN